ncbi:MAG: hypothetical protein WCX75_06395, partial [Fibrobacteraceae bacterium]
ILINADNTGHLGHAGEQIRCAMPDSHAFRHFERQLLQKPETGFFQKTKISTYRENSIFVSLPVS